MYKIDFSKPIHIHFIGIGGISMSGLAKILLQNGFTISGSDARESALTQQLEASGAQIFYGQKASNIIDGIDCVVYTAAINRDNAESIVTEVFEICGKLKKEYPLQNNPEFFLTISFHDESEEAVDGKWLFGGAYFSPFRPDDFTGEYATADSVLKEIYEKLYLPSE